MELANFTFDPRELAVLNDISLASDLATALVNDVYAAWAGSLNAITPTPSTQRLRADLKRIDQGASGVEVLEIAFHRQYGAGGLVATFIARVHPMNALTTAATHESALADVLSRSGREAICCRIIPGQFLDGRAVVYYHA